MRVEPINHSNGEDDATWMRHALRLAERAQGRTAPNPAVGALLVRDGVVLGEGWSAPAGGPHAEIMALRQAGERARGATLYVTLEPCAHFGRTPPCTSALIAAGISRAVVAILDPFPAMRGRGIALLEESGIDVQVGVLPTEAIEINAGFLIRQLFGLPHVTAKFAMTLDGRIATRTGHSRWITGPEARREGHRLRDRSDAILIGIGTLLADDPLLTTRLPLDECGDGGPHHPLRVILDSRARTPLDSALLNPATPGSTLIAVTEYAPSAAISALRAAGADVATLSAIDGRVDLHALLSHLAERGINTVLIEGGASIHGAFFDADLIDSVVAFVAPTLVGGATAPGPIGGLGHELMSSARRLAEVQTRGVGADIMVSGRIHPLPALEDLRCSAESSKRSGRSSHSSLAEERTP